MSKKTKKEADEGTIIGMDFGTSNSGAAALDDAGMPRPIKNAEGEFLTPSVACFTEDNQIVIGMEAKNMAVAYPQSVIREIKRQMGKTGPDGKPIPFYIDKEGRGWIPEELAALILKKIKKDAEAFLGWPIGPVMVTVPAYYTDAERRATQNAAKAAGLDVIGLMNEPTAAAVYYGVARKTNKPRLYLICDLGGGTFDVSLIRVENGNITVIATDGERNLGGTDWSQRIQKRVEQELKKQGITLDPVNDAAACQDILDKVEKLKHSISAEGRTEATFSANVQSRPISFKYTRQEFESDTRDLLERMGTKVSAAIKAGGTTPSALDDTLLVGGATRMPMVMEYLAQLLGKPPKRDADPDLVVAMGAALAAAKMVKANGGTVRSLDGRVIPSLPGGIFVNVAAHALGCAAVYDNENDRRFTPIIKKNSQIPAKSTQCFGLVKDHQTVARVEVYQGQEGTPLNKCLHIGDVELTGLPTGPAGKERISVTYEYDRDCIVKVTVEDSMSGKSTHGEIKHQHGMTEAEVVNARERIDETLK